MPVERAGMVYWRLSAPLFRMWLCCGSLANYPWTVTSNPWWKLAMLTVCLVGSSGWRITFKTCLSCTERHVPKLAFLQQHFRGFCWPRAVGPGWEGSCEWWESLWTSVVPWAMHCWVSFRELFAVSKTEPIHLSLVSFVLGMISLPHLGALLPA